MGFNESVGEVVTVAKPVELIAVSLLSIVIVFDAEFKVRAAPPPEDKVTAPAPV